MQQPVKVLILEPVELLDLETMLVEMHLGVIGELAAVAAGVVAEADKQGAGARMARDGIAHVTATMKAMALGDEAADQSIARARLDRASFSLSELSKSITGVGAGGGASGAGPRAGPRLAAARGSALGSCTYASLCGGAAAAHLQSHRAGQEFGAVRFQAEGGS